MTAGTEAGFAARSYLPCRAMWSVSTGGWRRKPGAMLAWLAVAGLASACVTTPDLGGPLPVRNQHPAQLTVLHMNPASADVLAPGAASTRADFAYTSLFLIGDGANNSRWVMDGETLRSAATLRLGLGKGLEFGTQVAAIHTTGGFLDSFVIGYHDLFGLPDQNRDVNPRDAFTVDASRNGQTVWSLDRAGIAFADLPLQLTYQLREPGRERLGVAVRGGVELPTGDASRGFGNGQLDASLGVLFDYRALGMGFYGHASHTFAGTPSQARAAGLDFAGVTSAGLAIELPLQPDLHAFTQIEWETSTLRHLGPKVTERQQVLLWVGGRYAVTPAFGVELGFAEDLVALASPDFTAWLGFELRPGR